MDVRNCRQCGRLYNYIGGSYRNICPDCIAALEEKFAEVKQYIEDHRTAMINEVSNECGVGVRQIEQWVREERLCFADDSPIGLDCEVCGKTIKTGRFCESCKNSMINQFGSMYPQADSHYKKRRADASAKMRFLE